MREWHVEHMQKTIIKYVTGISDTMSLWQTRQYLNYYDISNVQKTIYYDTRHGVTKEEVLLFIDKSEIIHLIPLFKVIILPWKN